MTSVADVERSIAFYALLGFEVGNTFRNDAENVVTWAFLEYRDARIMLSRASTPAPVGKREVLFYLYYDDIVSEHARLTAAGASPGPMAYPFYCPKGEFEVTDPGGFCVMLTHT